MYFSFYCHNPPPDSISPLSHARARSIFLQGWPTPPAEWTSGVSDEEYAFWTKALAIRGAANRAVEEARREAAWKRKHQGKGGGGPELPPGTPKERPMPIWTKLWPV